MKKNTLIIIALIISSAAFAQTIDWVKEYYVRGYYGKQITGFIKDASGNFHMSAKGNNYSGGGWNSNLYKLNTNGDILFSDTASDHTWNSLQLYNNSIYTMGTELTKRDINGNILSQQNLIWVGTSNLHANDAEILDGFLYAIQFGDLIKYDLQGNQIWNQSLGAGTASHMKLEVSNGYIYILSHFWSGGGRILKYDTLGNQIWNKSAGCMADNIYTDNNSNCYVFGSNLGPQGVVVKLDVNGNQVWSQTHDSIYFRNGMVYNDTLYACGYAKGVGVTEHDKHQGGFVRMSAQTGQIYSSNKYNFFTGICSDERLTHIYADNNGIYLGGTYCGEGPKLFLAKLSYNTLLVVPEKKTADKLIIFPNPTAGIFQINYSSSERNNLQLNITNSKGQIIYTEGISNFNGEHKKDIDLSKQAKGVYFIEIINNKKKEVKKVVLD